MCVDEGARLIALVDVGDCVDFAEQWRRDAFAASEFWHDELDSLALALRLVAPLAWQFWRGVDACVSVGCNPDRDDYEFGRRQVVARERRMAGYEDEEDE